MTDGDTITVIDAVNVQNKVRLMGIDAPEKKQAFGNRSKQHLSYLVYDKPVSIEWTKHDRYGRIVGKVMVSPPEACPQLQTDCPKTLDAGLAQITVGLAWHYKQYAKEHTEEDRARYALAEGVGIIKDVFEYAGHCNTAELPLLNARCQKCREFAGRRRVSAIEGGHVLS
ncbi:MAG TPA: thermonuclease family protein [Terriglobales bacterium]